MVAGAFVGNYNGAKKFKLASIPVWQMIWFSLALFSISVPLSLFCSEFCIPKALHADGCPYFKILMFMTPICGIYYALSSFFVAIGRGGLVTIGTIVANVVNVIVDIVLVFGLFGIDNFMGTKGAAIGTVLSNIVNAGILFYFFFRKDIRQKYGTLNLKLQIKPLLKCLKLGAAGGVGHAFEMSAWSVIYYLLASINKETAMLQSIAVSVNLFMAFIVSGLEKGVMAITSNLLGAGLKQRIQSMFQKAVSIHFMFTGLFAIVVFFFPEVIINNFVRFEISPELLNQLIFVLRLVLLYFLADGMVWVIAGIVEAGGDINYTMVSIATCLWGIVAIPSYIIYKFGMLHIETTWILLFMSVVSIFVILYHRYKSDRWIHIKA
jgi:MATE family multidrug resistance protein